MAHLSRRAFLSVAGGLAMSWGLPLEQAARALDKPIRPAAIPSSLIATIRKGPPGNKGYQRLLPAGGEPVTVRTDLVSADPAGGRANTRRSLLYLGHLSDIHIMDAQSPARIEPMSGLNAEQWAGAMRAQDTLTLHVLAAMVQAVNNAASSPITGAPMAMTLNTGDSADMHSSLELKWYIDALDGAGPIVANSGKAGEYEGIQVWPECTYAYHPDDPANDVYGAQYGFPAYPGMLTAAVTEPIEMVGLNVPWYTVFGNHDSLFFGGFQVNWTTQNLAIGDRKNALWQPLLRMYGDELGATTSFERLLYQLEWQFGLQDGVRTVTPDPARKIFDQQEFIQAHLDSPPEPGPVGHGFTAASLADSRTYWTIDATPYLRVFGLDTCNLTVGADGAVPEVQYDWLEQQLAQARNEKKLAIVISHHTSQTLENEAQPVIGPNQKLYHADEFIAMLLKYPNLIAWMNGHTHYNRITAHPRPGEAGGFWEINAASCIDYAQQQRVTDIVDNRDGTLSIFTLVLDHDSPAQTSPADFSQKGLAAISRELSANDFVETTNMRPGSAYDRNVELMLPAPFDLSTISDQVVEAQHVQQRAQLLKRAGVRR